MTAKTGKDLTPLIMGIFLFSGIIAVALLRIYRLEGAENGTAIIPDVIFVGLYLLWLIIELHVSGRDVNAAGKSTFDAMTCQIYGFGQALTILTGLWFPSLWPGFGLPHVLGMGIFLTGVGYRLWAVRTLGRFYSHRVRKAADHRIVAGGPYKLTRHPAYAGMIVANAGVSAYFFNWATLGIFLLVLVPAIFLRIRVEEKMLFGLEGYADFARNRKRLFPAVW